MKTMGTLRKILTGMTLTVIALFAATVVAQAQTTTKQAVKGEGTVTTEKMSGEVVYVEGNTLVVRMANGEYRTFSNIPDSRRATIDGKPVGVRELVPGTKLTATITRTTTPVTVRTTTVGTGKVRYVMGNTVILTLENGQTKQYVVKPDYKFNINGKPASVNELREGMNVSAEKIVEEPSVEITTDSNVVGQAPRAAAAAAPAAARPPAAAAAPAAAPAPSAPPAAPAAKQLPKTGSPVFLGGLLGLLLVGGSAAIRRLRRS
jgi:LPXTG-motif cell wall-anchored protein